MVRHMYSLQYEPDPKTKAKYLISNYVSSHKLSEPDPNPIKIKTFRTRLVTDAVTNNGGLKCKIYH